MNIVININSSSAYKLKRQSSASMTTTTTRTVTGITTALTPTDAKNKDNETTTITVETTKTTTKTTASTTRKQHTQGIGGEGGGSRGRVGGGGEGGVKQTLLSPLSTQPAREVSPHTRTVRETPKSPTTAGGPEAARCSGNPVPLAPSYEWCSAWETATWTCRVWHTA